MDGGGTREYQIEPVAPGAYAALARAGGVAICNSGLVDLGDGSMLFDTSLTSRAARELRTTARERLGSGLTAVANSHWHLDHMLGNPEFATTPIWGTRRTREIVLARTGELRAELAQEALDKGVRELEGRRATLQTPGALADLEFVLSIYRALREEVGTQKLLAPDRTFETKVQLPGSRGAELLSFGEGHTDADAVLFLPHERVLFAGDLVVSGVQPSLGSGNPEHWLVVLDELEKLRPEAIVPGHGPVLGPDGFAEIRGYLRGVLKAAAASPEAVLPVAIRRWEGSVSLEENLRFARERRPPRTRRRRAASPQRDSG